MMPTLTGAQPLGQLPSAMLTPVLQNNGRSWTVRADRSVLGPDRQQARMTPLAANSRLTRLRFERPKSLLNSRVRYKSGPIHYPVRQGCGNIVEPPTKLTEQPTAGRFADAPGQALVEMHAPTPVSDAYNAFVAAAQREAGAADDCSVEHAAHHS
jgi:hypothetical protein